MGREKKTWNRPWWLVAGGWLVKRTSDHRKHLRDEPGKGDSIEDLLKTL
jgi:hypothetical protein